MRVRARRSSWTAASAARLPGPPLRSEATASPPPALWARYAEHEQALADLPTADRLAALKAVVRALVQAAMSGRAPESEPVLSRGSFRVMVRVAAVEREMGGVTLQALAGKTGVEVLRRLDHLRGLLLDLFC